MPAMYTYTNKMSSSFHLKMVTNDWALPVAAECGCGSTQSSSQSTSIAPLGTELGTKSAFQQVSMEAVEIVVGFFLSPQRNGFHGRPQTLLANRSQMDLSLRCFFLSAHSKKGIVLQNRNCTRTWSPTFSPPPAISSSKTDGSSAENW